MKASGSYLKNLRKSSAIIAYIALLISISVQADMATIETYGFESDVSFHFQDKDDNEKRKQILTAVDSVFKQGFAKALHDPRYKGDRKIRCFYKQVSNTQMIVTVIISLGMGFNLLSIYEGNVTPFSYDFQKNKNLNLETALHKVGAVAACMPLSTAGLQTAYAGYKDLKKPKSHTNKKNKRKRKNRSTASPSTPQEKEMKFSTKVITDETIIDATLNKIASDDKWKTVDDKEVEAGLDLSNSSGSIDKKNPTRRRLAYVVGAVIAMLDGSFDGFLSVKSGINFVDYLLPNAGGVPKVIGGIVTGSWNIVANWGTAFLGSTKLATAMIEPKKEKQARPENVFVDNLISNTNLREANEEETTAFATRLQKSLIDCYADEEYDLQQVLKIREMIQDKVNQDFKVKGCCDPSTSSMRKTIGTVLKWGLFSVATVGIAQSFSADQVSSMILAGASAGPLAVGVLALVVYTIQGVDVNLVAFSTLNDAIEFVKNGASSDTRQIISTLQPSYYSSRAMGAVLSLPIGYLYTANLWGALAPIMTVNGLVLGGINATVTGMNATCGLTNSTLLTAECTALGWGLTYAPVSLIPWMCAAVSLGVYYMGGTRIITDRLELLVDHGKAKYQQWWRGSPEEVGLSIRDASGKSITETASLISGDVTSLRKVR